MRTLFVSYARENRSDVDQLVAHLEMMGYETWVDVSLRGGQDWWEEILRRIAETDAIITIVSRAVLNSTACQRGVRMGTSTGQTDPACRGRTHRPIGVAPSTRKTPDHRLLQPHTEGQIGTSGPARPGKPARGTAAAQSPARPTRGTLSYPTDIVDIATQATPLDQDRQREVLLRLEPALHASDPAERQAGHDILERFGQRTDLYADVYRSIARLKEHLPTPSTSRPRNRPARPNVETRDGHHAGSQPSESASSCSARDDKRNTAGLVRRDLQ